jgi:hypothetical protein
MKNAAHEERTQISQPMKNAARDVDCQKLNMFGDGDKLLTADEVTEI